MTLPNESRSQLSLIAFPGGQASRFTNDLSDYGEPLDLTRDGKSLVALERRQVSHIWMLPHGQASQAKQITFGDLPDTLVNPGPAGKLLVLGNARQVELIGADGGQRTPVLPQSRTVTTFSTCGDRYIVLDSYTGAKVELWRTDADGTNPTKLADDGIFPTCTQDGKWIFYAAEKGPNVLRLASEGGSRQKSRFHIWWPPLRCPPRQMESGWPMFTRRNLLGPCENGGSFVGRGNSYPSPAVSQPGGRRSLVTRWKEFAVPSGAQWSEQHLGPATERSARQANY